jgi:hypothetical protein
MLFDPELKLLVNKFTKYKSENQLCNYTVQSRQKQRFIRNKIGFLLTYNKKGPMGLFKIDG